MNALDLITSALLFAGLFFFVAGTIGLFRFPDLYTRLHALTKADNTGLGCVVLARMLQADSVSHAAKLALVWLLVIAASATVCVLIGNAAHRRGLVPWRRPSV